ncbi:MAG TPA: hydroxymethylbilane synthase [Candidatus Acidoferrales bacterium]|nr:hydroxymethylbilane synthase [Candidatus Acidoferrales bacterium]
MKPLRIATRGSVLALWQANHIRERLAQLHGIDSELIRIRTSGDKFQGSSVAEVSQQVGTKGIFIKELEEALLAGNADLAVHSMKDVPTENPAGLVFPAIIKREDVRDCLISRNGARLKDIASGARIGTSSLRRQAQVRHHRPDLQLFDLRGNVDTRLKKVAAGEFDAIVLATAGINRLGASDKITEIIPPEIMLPAVGQGALGIETRADDRETSRFVAALDDLESHAAVTAERALLRELEGGCQIPLGAWARFENGELRLEACVFSADGKEFVRKELRGQPGEAEKLGVRLGQIMIEAGADRILRLAGRSVGRS